MTRCVFPMAGELVVKSVQEFKDERIVVAVRAPGIYQAQEMVVKLIFFSLLEKFIDAQRGRNLLHQHLNILPNR